MVRENAWFMAGGFQSVSVAGRPEFFAVEQIEHFPWFNMMGKCPWSNRDIRTAQIIGYHQAVEKAANILNIN
jgi:hypothetical protein